MTLEAKRTLIYAILKFLRDELKQENISPDFKESLEGIFFLLSIIIAVITQLFVTKFY